MTEAPLTHLGIIMDGNGRWARSRGLRRIEGHRAAERSIHDAVEYCGEAGVKYLTLYAFSTENWKRPKTEVSFIMALLRSFIKRNIDSLHSNRVKVMATGRLDDLPQGPLKELRAAMKRTENNDGLSLILALSYGGRAELADAVVKIARRVVQGDMQPDDIDEGTIASDLYLPDVPDPEMIIRTSGERRLSNFLLWESAYSELYFTEVLWPDFRKEHLQEAFEDFRRRKRRFGNVDPD
ncbi:MAG: isoprenyl transferase [Candidatus Fermentibacteraceae bacterium]|nr:isoprenyl transferase [Candidatus Fermentibacteraceae bacterium]MBN2607777.1 isoprenyl transferase [Candidatus Fermentibacteraceae bacterium]